MSTAPPASAHPSPPPAPTPDPVRNEVKIVSHSFLFYWWPVWLVGFILAILTFMPWDNHRMVIVPAGSFVGYDATVMARVAMVEQGKPILGPPKEYKNREVVILPEYNKHQEAGGARHLRKQEEGLKDSPPKELFLHITNNPSYGVLFTTVLILVIIITNVPLRGMWSVMIITLIVLLSIIFGLAGWWGPILETLHLLDIRINAGGYFFISLILFAIWLITLVFFDRQIYIVFTPGQFKVCTEIGGGEKVFDVVGMKMEKQRSNLFLHWVLGLGSGDLIVRTAGAAAEHFDLQNVLFIGRKVRMIEEMLQQRKVVETR
jgi:hypothetical protein